MSDIPEGFTVLFRTSPFLDAMGPFYQRVDGDSLIIGLRITEQHTNTRGTAHGGLLIAMADIALGYNAAFVGVEKERGAIPSTLLTTASITADFAGSAKLGDWVEAHVDVQRVGGRLAFANAYLWLGTERLVRASAVFSVASKADRTSSMQSSQAPA